MGVETANVLELGHLRGFPEDGHGHLRRWPRKMAEKKKMSKICDVERHSHCPDGLTKEVCGAGSTAAATHTHSGCI